MAQPQPGPVPPVPPELPGRSELPLLPATAGRWLLVFAVAYSVLHHQGFVLARLGSVPGSGTRWADWIDLVTPYVVLVPALITMVRLRGFSTAPPGPVAWTTLAVGSILYTQGHGIHLAANSISNLVVDEEVASPALTDIVHLWDELIGHYLWYGGFSLVVVAVTMAVGRHRLEADRGGLVVSTIVAAAAGVTYATNALEGHFAWPGLMFAGVMSVVLVRALRRARSPGVFNQVRRVADLVLVGFASAVLLLGFYGCWHRGFPDPSSVGWNLLAR